MRHCWWMSKSVPMRTALNVKKRRIGSTGCPSSSTTTSSTGTTRPHRGNRIKATSRTTTLSSLHDQCGSRSTPRTHSIGLADAACHTLVRSTGMQMAHDVASFTPSEADQLRRAMGAKRFSEKMRALMARFFEGAAANGVPK
jgi:hypothetical protein